MTEILKGVHHVDGSNANCYFVEQDDGSLMLVDAGVQPDGRKILGYLTDSLKKQPSDVKSMVLTHCHVDHVRGAAAIKTATGAKVEAHQAEADYISGAKKYPGPGGAAGVLFALISPFFSSRPVPVDVRLAQDDKVGGYSVIHTPGHTPGSIALYNPQAKVLFVGDTARCIKGKLVGPPPSFTADMSGAKASLARLAGLDFDVLLSGHGDPLRSKDAPQMLKDLSESL
jgi:glyoxylase-like metal-dependent hydrolase (beta-lactamase superfamily II)